MIFATLPFYAGATFFLGIIAVPWAAPAGQMFGFEDLFVTVEGALTVALPLVFIALAIVSVFRDPPELRRRPEHDRG